MNDFINDIPVGLAYSAYRNISFDPEKRATEVIADYVNGLELAYSHMSVNDRLCSDSELMDQVKHKYREKYKAKFRAYLTSMSRCASAMVVGPAKFPTAQMAKRNETNIKRLNEFLDFRKNGIARVIRQVEIEAKRRPLSGRATEMIFDSQLTLQDDPEANRVRIFFPYKPDTEARTQLKKNGFRWTPSLGCWQAYRNDRSFAFAAAMIVGHQS